MYRSSIRARTTTTIVVTGVLVFGGLAAAAPASAAPAGDYTTLATAFTGSGTVELSASISSPSSDLVLAAGATQILDLGTHTLSVHSLSLGAGSTLTITGSSGVLTSNASDLDPAGFYVDARAGINVPATASLTIASGTVNATGGGQSAAGIGAQGHGSVHGGLGSISITGGTVTAVGSYLGAGIGEAAQLPAGDGSISISGGTVTATGGERGAGIGGGWASRVTTISISGGTITATGGDDGAGIGGGESGGGAGAITISGGTITATAGENGAAIGSGANYGSGAGAGTINITAGTIVADSSAGYGAAIGAGYGNQPIAITIASASITTTSDNGAGIGGGGYGGGNGAILINSGTFTILSGGGAGIGSGSNSAAGDITINGGTFSITADSGGAAIGGGLLGSASSTILNAGTFTLVSETLAPVIGSGVAGGAGGTITIANGVVASVWTDQTNTVVGGTNGSANITLNGRLTILGGRLIAPSSGGGLTLGTTGVLRGPGELTGASAVINNGSITGSVNVTATNVQVNNFFVTYQPDASIGYAGGTQRVYATSFARAELPLADPVASYDVQWFDAPVAGVLFTTTTAIASDISLYPVFAVSTLPNSGTDSIVVLPYALVALLLGAGLLMLRRRVAA